MSKNFTVKQSGIHGKGMFATKDFKKGDVVFIFKGKVYKRVNKTLEDTFANPDSVGIDKNTWIDPEGDFHFINHSCNPNLGIKGRVTYCALKNIKKGEELTFDYSINEADPNWQMKCSCGAENCRKIVKSIEFLPKETYQQYLPFVPTYFSKVYNKS